VSGELAGRVALVTGAGSGLGRGFALTLARHGAAVAVASRRESKLGAVVAEIEALGGKALALTLDVTKADDIEGALDACEASVGMVDVLVNNAGVPDAKRAHRMDVALVDAVLDTNVRGPWLLATSVARRLIAQETPGRIVNISSMSAYHYAGEGAALYSVSKAAVSRMTEVLAVEWARHHINVNAIAPGAFASEMMDGMLERMGDFYESFPRQRLGDPAMLDSSLLYLVSPASEAVTGTILRVDDGQTHR
jgi:NAD(P)-dependent dehydrogenase (short-subunit alcohol dehydrogenase family)